MAQRVSREIFKFCARLEEKLGRFNPALNPADQTGFEDLEQHVRQGCGYVESTLWECSQTDDDHPGKKFMLLLGLGSIFSKTVYQLPIEAMLDRIWEVYPTKYHWPRMTRKQEALLSLVIAWHGCRTDLQFSDQYNASWVNTVWKTIRYIARKDALQQTMSDQMAFYAAHDLSEDAPLDTVMQAAAAISEAANEAFDAAADAFRWDDPEFFASVPIVVDSAETGTSEIIDIEDYDHGQQTATAAAGNQPQDAPVDLTHSVSSIGNILISVGSLMVDSMTHQTNTSLGEDERRIHTLSTLSQAREHLLDAASILGRQLERGRDNRSQQVRRPSIAQIRTGRVDTHRRRSSVTPTISAETNNTTCTICLELLPLAVARQTEQHVTCRHRFHPQCLMRWFETNPTCPDCRSDASNYALSLLRP